MTGRILRIELRRSAALWAALAIVASGVTLLYVVVSTWGGRWMPLAVVQREQLYVLWPLALGAGAWQARRESRARVGELMGTTPRPRWQRVGPVAGAMALAAAAGYLVMFGAAAAGQVVAGASYFPAGSLPVVAVGALAMVVAVWLGLAIGSLLPSPFTAPALVIAGMAALMSVPILISTPTDNPGTTLLSPVLTPPTARDFVSVVGRVHLAQLVWLAALAATAIALYSSSTRRGRLAAVLPALVGVAVALPLLPAHTDGAYVADPASYAPVCSTDAPRVCVTTVHAATLDRLRAPARRALAILAAKVPGAPTTVMEARTMWIAADAEPRRPDTVLVELRPDIDGRLDARHEPIWDLLDGAGTRPCRNILDAPAADAVDRHHTARLAAAAWLLDQAPPRGAYYAGQARQAWETLRGLPADEQRARVAALRVAALACDGRDLLDVLIGRGPR